MESSRSGATGCNGLKSDASQASLYELLHDDSEEEAKEEGKGTFASAVFNLTNTILGSGTLCLPFAMECSGSLLGTGTMLAIALTTCYSVNILLKASDQAGPGVPQNYEGLGFATLGRGGTYISEFTFIFGGFGTLMSYFIFIGQLISDVFGIPTAGQKWVSLAAVVVVVMPLSCLKDVSSLKYSSLAAVLTVCYVVICVVVASLLTPVGYAHS